MTRAIILAAGRGGRLKEMTINTPKCFVKLNNISLIERTLNTLKKSNINEIAIVTGYCAENFSTLASVKSFFYNEAWEQTNMVYSLTKASDWLKQYNCIISYSDIFYHASVIEDLAHSEADIAISYDKNFASLWQLRFSNPLEDLETFRVSKNQQIIEIGNKPSSIEEIEGQFMGLMKITPAGWHKLFSIYQQLSLSVEQCLDLTGLLKLAIQNNITITGIPYDKKWGEIDILSDLLLYETLSLNNGLF